MQSSCSASTREEPGTPLKPAVLDDVVLHTLSTERIPGTIKKLRGEMKRAAQALNFEKAAELRDRIKDLEQWVMEIQEP